MEQKYQLGLRTITEEIFVLWPLATKKSVFACSIREIDLLLTRYIQCGFDTTRKKNPVIVDEWTSFFLNSCATRLLGKPLTRYELARIFFLYLGSTHRQLLPKNFFNVTLKPPRIL